MFTRRPSISWCAMLILLTPGHIVAQPLPLEGVQAVRVAIVLTGDVPSDITTNRFQTILELRLREAGLTVTSLDVGQPTIGANLHFVRVEDERRNRLPLGYAATALLAVRQRHVLRNKAVAPLYLWSDLQLGVAASDETFLLVERLVRHSLDEFVNQWLRANPRR